MVFSYLRFVSYVLIPFQMVLLGVLAFGVLCRKQVVTFIQKGVNFTLDVNGLKIRLYTMFTFASLVQMLSLYLKICQLHEDRLKGKHEDGHSDINQGEFDKILFMSYRNLLIHLTNVILTF